MNIYTYMYIYIYTIEPREARREAHAPSRGPRSLHWLQLSVPPLLSYPSLPSPSFP